jgi:ribokinase
MKPKIVVVGSANTDMVVNVHHLPKPGETVLGADYIQSMGGKGANQAVAAARLGADVTLVARLGRDALGESSIAAYRSEGVNIDHIIMDEKKPSGVALIMVDDYGENIIAVAQGANAELSKNDIFSAEGAIQSANCLLVQLEIPLDTVQAAVDLAVKHNVPIILNPAPATKLSSSLLSAVDYLTPNENEAILLAGEGSSSSLMESARFLKSNFNIKNLILTLGEKGAAIIDEQSQIVPSYKVNPIDTTGAGDAFNGALAVALARGFALREAVLFANAVAALTTTSAGAQSSLPTKKVVEEYIKNQPIL